MSETMTRGSPIMALHGSQMRHDLGTLAQASKLPIPVGVDYPIMVNPGIFSGLLEIGITSITSHKNMLAIETQTGMRAKLPVVPDPHRVMELRLSEGGELVTAELFTEWLNRSVAISKAINRYAGSVYTYRSNTFVYNSSVLISSRLSKGWPTQNIASPRLLAALLAYTASDPVTAAICSEYEVLVKTASGTCFRGESAEDQLPTEPIDLLARFKSHSAPSIQSLDASELRRAATQLRVVSDAPGQICAKAVVKIKTDSNGLLIQYLDNKLHLPCENWALGHLEVPLRSFITLSAIPTDCTEVHITSSPKPGTTSPMDFRADYLSFFMAAAAKGG